MKGSLTPKLYEDVRDRLAGRGIEHLKVDVFTQLAASITTESSFSKVLTAVFEISTSSLNAVIHRGAHRGTPV
jgi:hypothetical protein